MSPSAPTGSTTLQRQCCGWRLEEYTSRRLRRQVALGERSAWTPIATHALPTMCYSPFTISATPEDCIDTSRISRMGTHDL